MHTITLTWTASDSPDVAGYRLYYGEYSGSYPNTIDAGNQTTVDVPNLIEGTMYYFAATAYTADGSESVPSDEIHYMPNPASPIPFTMDGNADATGYLEASNGMTIYAAVRGTLLYVATWSPGSNGSGVNDYFIFVSDQLLPSASTIAPWAKMGRIGVAENKPFLAGESQNAYAGWFNAPLTSSFAKASTNSGQLEGVIDLVAAFGSMPQTIYLASAAYGTDDNSPLVAQCPAGNGNGNLDPNEFLALQIPAILDQNADGVYDRLDPARDFLSSAARDNSDVLLTWNSVPGRNYQVLWSSSLTSGWQNAPNGFFNAGPSQLTLSFRDLGALNSGPRFYKVQLLP